MKRRAFKLLLFLLAGALINVAVAWASASTTTDLKKLGRRTTGTSIQANRWWEVSTWTRPTNTFVWWCVFGFRDNDKVIEQSPESVIPWWCSLPRSIEHIPPSLVAGDGHRSHVISHHAAAWGLPIRCLSLEYRIDPNEGQVVVGGLELEAREYSYFPRALPLQPIWRGMLANTIFYAAVLWLLFAAPFDLRKWRRIKRGQCASCGYSLRESVSEKCPECGATA